MIITKHIAIYIVFNLVLCGSFLTSRILASRPASDGQVGGTEAKDIGRLR
jgi:hypothetical protein